MIDTGIYIVEPEILENMEDEVVTGFPEIIELQRKKGRKVAVYPVSEKGVAGYGMVAGIGKMRKVLYGE